VEKILEAQFSRGSLDPEVARWVAALEDVPHARMVAVGLAEPRETAEQVTLETLLERFESTASVRDATKAAYRQTTGSLRNHFGGDKPLSTLTFADADGWRKAIVDSGLAAATVAKRVFVARAIFKRAVRWGLLDASPFSDLRAGSQSNPERSFYVTRKAIAAILTVCPDRHWRGVVALTRFAGLRCPSELSVLRWGDVNWEKGRLTVRSPKTSGHDGHAVRIVPIAMELRPILQDLFDAALEGQEAVLPRLSDAKANLRTMFEKLITRAGLTPWPRLFHNLRASCAMDWVERFPSHVVARWLGHSPLIAAQHYLHTRDEHFDLAAGVTGGLEKSDAKSDASVTQKAAQRTSARIRMDSQESSEVLVGAGVTRGGARDRETTRNEAMGEEGFEPPKA